MAGPVSIRADDGTARADKFATQDDGTLYAVAVIGLHRKIQTPRASKRRAHIPTTYQVLQCGCVMATRQHRVPVSIGDLNCQPAAYTDGR